MSLIQQLDTAALLFIQEHLRCGVLTPIMIFLSALGSSGLIWAFAALLMLIFKKTRYCGVVLLMSLVFSWLVNDFILKPLFQRPRPYVTLPELLVLIPKLQEFSFPSGHTSTAFASAFAIVYTLGKRWSGVYILAVLIAFSRLYLGMHYPTDVLGGMVLGTTIGLLVCTLSRKLLKPSFNNKRHEIR